MDLSWGSTKFLEWFMRLCKNPIFSTFKYLRQQSVMIKVSILTCLLIIVSRLIMLRDIESSKNIFLVSLEIPPTHQIFFKTLPLLFFLEHKQVSSTSTISPIPSFFLYFFFCYNMSNN
ncbi:hypothetical protein CDIK_3333 [Cucumispora dikerogammari]|nr:hypothetical protein CDIK_3333 [Cucumispora dikerogammari]